MGRFYKIIIIVLYFILNNSYLSFSQSATARLSRNDILIGDQVTLTLEFSCPADINVNFPVFKDTLSKNVEIVQSSKVETSLSDDKKQKIFRQLLTITSFDSGYFPIKPIQFKYKQGTDTASHFVETQAMLLTVRNMNVDVQKGIRDIKPPMEARFTFREALPYIMGLIIAIALIYFLFYYLKKKKKKEPIFRMPSRPKLPPHEIALAALEALRNKKLWQNNKIKEFHTELTEIIRQYIEDRYSIPALEMISDDIIDKINSLNVDNDVRIKLREMLSLADLVKFAKQNPLPSEHDKSFNNAIDFVKGTIVQLTMNNEE